MMADVIKMIKVYKYQYEEDKLCPNSKDKVYKLFRITLDDFYYSLTIECQIEYEILMSGFFVELNILLEPIQVVLN